MCGRGECFLMVRRRICAVSNHEARLWPHRSRRRFVAPQDEGLTSRLQRLLDLRLQHAVEIVRRDGPHQLVEDRALAADDKGLRHAIDAPFDRGAAISVDADCAEWVAVAAEEAPRIV